MRCNFCGNGELLTGRAEWQHNLEGNHYFIFCDNCLNGFSDKNCKTLFSLADLSKEKFNLENLILHHKISQAISLVLRIFGINNLRQDFQTVERLRGERL